MLLSISSNHFSAGWLDILFNYNTDFLEIEVSQKCCCFPLKASDTDKTVKIIPHHASLTRLSITAENRSKIKQQKQYTIVPRLAERTNERHRLQSHSIFDRKLFDHLNRTQSSAWEHGKRRCSLTAREHRGTSPACVFDAARWSVLFNHYTVSISSIKKEGNVMWVTGPCVTTCCKRTTVTKTSTTLQ